MSPYLLEICARSALNCLLFVVWVLQSLGISHFTHVYLPTYLACYYVFFMINIFDVEIIVG